MRGGVTLALLGLTGCPSPSTTALTHGGLRVFAEGPCAELSIHAVGSRRFVTYGDTGYDLHGWLPGDHVAAAQAVVEVVDGRAFFNEAFAAGLPTDARGYVPGSLELGGDFDTGAWLLRTTTRYARGGTGALFEREGEGYLHDGVRWRRSDEPVALPAGARGLPGLPTTVCAAGLSFVPLAWTATTTGGVVIAGRCDDDKPTNVHDPVVVALHGAARATAWRVERVPGTDHLDGIVNLELAARDDDDVYLTAYEPFRPREARESFLARFDGDAWSELDWPIEGGTMSIALGDAGEAWVAASRALYRRSADGRVEPVNLAPLRFAKVDASALHVHGVRRYGDELWAAASYRVAIPGSGGRDEVVWASALFTSVATGVHHYCDARETADEALYEVE